MNQKPSVASGYDPKDRDRVLETRLDAATKLGDLINETVIVGGLVPSLLDLLERLEGGS